ncbi:MAG: CDP-diacylglycerol--serine O-phosphatidyltransferase, partial [Methanosphaera sp.]|nr:CDP-diacylglycerol--serine O-phosphatidyltransferase [Methanosphaera sp.]
IGMIKMETNILKMLTVADITSICNASCGLLAILTFLQGQNILSAQLLLLALVFDSIDGTLARYFKSTSNDLFGINIDSLADIISFGLAPTIILFMFTSSNWIILPCLLLMICGLLRLTRYNTLTLANNSSTRDFIGLPVPITALITSSLLLSSITNIWYVVILYIIVSILMVSDITYPKITDIKFLVIPAIILILCLIPSINEILLCVPSYLLLVIALVYIFGNIILTLYYQTRDDPARLDKYM